LAAVLIDLPANLSSLEESRKLLKRIHELNRSGVAVVIATREPEVAAQAEIIYKVAHGNLTKITGTIEI